uniref:Uncharacterized protein n=1 Tax=Arundo donax TaxID=35708 RepID=A0A0A8Z911_ARUDO
MIGRTADAPGGLYCNKKFKSFCFSVCRPNMKLSV